jgi:acetylornithine deacetylase/succinyl-diaminopimelate desuccinylase-like protein
VSEARRFAPAAAGRWLAVAALVLSVAPACANTEDPIGELIRQRVVAYRSSNQATIVRELAALLELPNVASDLDDMARNAAALTERLEARGFVVRRLMAEGGPPVVFAERRGGASAEHTVVFYAHYDGQPVQPERWQGDPWQPCLRRGRLEDGAAVVDLEKLPERLDPEWRLYGRSASDDKGAIVALLAAIDALDAAGIPLSVHLKVFLDGEEEQGSPHLAEILAAHAPQLAADLWLICDGPVHQNRQPQVVFGVRGITGVQMTAYGPAVALHSGHYGNWAPNPGMLLAQLLATMRDPRGNPTIAGLAEAIRPLGPVARSAVAAAPEVESGLRRDLALAWSEGEPATLAQRITGFGVNLLGFETGAVGEASRNAIPATATAQLGFRLVPDLTPALVRQAVEAHISGQGFHIVHQEPSLELRRQQPRVILLEWGDGYPPLWTPMELPVSRAVVRVVAGAVRGGVVRTPSLGGSLPLHLFSAALGEPPIIVVPIANHDNNQHAPNENLRLKNLWDGIEIYGGLLARLGAEWEHYERLSRP